MLHLITYDLHSPVQNYSGLISAIKKYPYQKINLSCWVIRTNLTATQIRSTLETYIDSSDNLFVCDFHQWSSINLSREVTSWMNR